MAIQFLFCISTAIYPNRLEDKEALEEELSIKEEGDSEADYKRGFFYVDPYSLVKGK
jgi:hypothetical protein